MQFVLVVLVVAAVVYLISGPLREARARRDPQPAVPDTVAELMAARDAKYLEIRDAELDLRTGKLSAGDHAALDGALRAEAVEILHRLDGLQPGDASATAPGDERVTSKP